jgi:hypothetical protein
MVVIKMMDGMDGWMDGWINAYIGYKNEMCCKKKFKLQYWCMIKYEEG